MAQLAIIGHPSKGSKVIEILRLLGGINALNFAGLDKYRFYYIGKSGIICTCCIPHNCIAFTLEEFLEKFPYKVGDKVQHKGATSCGSVFEVEKMRWVGNHVEYTIKRLWHWNDHLTITAEDLQPYKEEAMEEQKAIPPYMDYDVKTEEPKELLIGFTKDNNGDWILNTHKDYEIKEENGKFKLIKKQPQYPKTYEECCKVLGAQQNRHYFYTIRDKQDYPHEVAIMRLLDDLKQLLICRGAYLQIAGERMKLGKPWESDWTISEYKFTIVEIAGIVVKDVDRCNKHILAFPTEEMRDAFYENFKELIEQCKELL